MGLRIGFGYDVHRLIEGEDFYLGGVKIEHIKGAIGHSDADTLLHAVCDALLGAANLRDIGFHFPDTDPRYKGIDSKKLLTEVINLLRDKGYELGNIDATVCLEVPKVNPHIPDIKQVMSEVMNVREDDISIKATTSEKMGFVGKKEGVSAHAVALLYRTGGKMMDSGDQRLSSS